MKISEHDRIQATLRHPQYLKDYAHVQKLKKDAPKIEITLSTGGLSTLFSRTQEQDKVLQVWIEENKIARKWGLSHLLNPKETPKKRSHSPVWVITADELGWRPRTPSRWTYSVEPKKTPKRTFNKLLRQVVNQINPATDLKDGRYLTLEIDLRERLDVLLKELKNQITYYRQYASLPEGKERETKLNPWRVYDMHHDQGKSILAIAREEFGFKGNPAYSEEAKKMYRRAEIAYKKACKMIEEVAPAD